MATREEEFQQHLLATFRMEAAERLRALSSGLIELERAQTPEGAAGLMETLVREAHSLKGAARAVNLGDIEATARAMERVLAALKQQQLGPSPALFDALQRGVDGTERFLAAMEAEGGAADKAAIQDAVRALEQVGAGGGEPGRPEAASAAPREAEGAAPLEAPPPPPPAAERRVAPDTVRIPAARLDALLLEVEQLLSAKLAAEYHVAELKALGRALGDWRKALGRFKPHLQPGGDEAARAGVAELLDAENRRIKLLESRLGGLEKAAEQNYRFLSAGVTGLLEDMKDVLMLPASTLVEILPRMVRDLSRDQGKEADLTVEGADIEIDKRILDEMKDPLIHLVRNCIDHGIEPPAERERKGKPRRGKVGLSIAQKEAGKVEIVIADDGAGMDPARMRAAAVKHGLLAQQEADRLSDQEALSLAFRSGVTTSPIVTDISGRGLGLAIVQEKVARLNGALAFDTAVDAGTTFRMVLPLTRATFRGLVVRCGEHLFIAPTANVERVLRIGRDAVRTVEHRETIELRGEVVSLARLCDVLELPSPAADTEAKVQAIVLGDGRRRIAFGVDEILNEQEVLVKPLGRQLARVRNMVGAAVLGTGAVVPILNVADLLVSAVKSAAGAAPRPAPEEAGKRTGSLLVVEDSITTRTLLKNILEAAGYAVRTAVDGVDALTQLREGEFDLVVSDVAMPRMDGFELTARVRADKRLAETPVVLVTALESREDRERGIDVGANAYIVKSSFDQSNLLATIRQLI